MLRCSASLKHRNCFALIVHSFLVLVLPNSFDLSTQSLLRIQTAYVYCSIFVCLCNQGGKLGLNTLRSGNANQNTAVWSAGTGLHQGCRRHCGCCGKDPDVPGLIRGTQEAQQWTYHHPATWRDVAATPPCCSDREPAPVHWSYTPAKPNLGTVSLSNCRLRPLGRGRGLYKKKKSFAR